MRILRSKIRLTGKNEIEGKTRQNTENKQTSHLTRKIESEEKTRQITENKQTFHFTGKIEIEEKLVKSLKINKL